MGHSSYHIGQELGGLLLSRIDLTLDREERADAVRGEHRAL